MNKKGFRYFCLLVLSVVILPLVSIFSPTLFARAENDEKVDVTIIEERVITKIKGDFSGVLIESVSDAFDVLDSLKDRFYFSSSRKALSFERTIESVVGEVYHFNQIVDGIEVYGSAVNLSVKGNHELSSILGKYYLDVDYDDEINFSKDDAWITVEASYDEDAEIEYLQTYIYDFEESEGYVAYAFNVSLDGEALKVFVSANTNEIKDELETETSFSKPDGNASEVTKETYTIENTEFDVDVTKYVTSSGYYYALSNESKKIWTANGRNQKDYTYVYYVDETGTKTFNDNDAIKAYSALLKCYDFYADENSFGVAKNGITFSGSNSPINLVAIVHFDSKYENAGFTQSSTSANTGYFIFGDGDGVSTKSFVNGVDVIGHEYQHAYTMQICDFDYEGESGALCEAFSDIFGAVIEGKGIDSAEFWLMGEDVSMPGYSVFRNMANPTKTKCTADYETFKYYVSSCGGKFNSDNDYGYIHTNCTLPTYATYLLYYNNPEFFTEYNILRLWYQTLVNLAGNNKATIEDFCEAMVQSAVDLNYSQDNKRLIERVFYSLGIPGYTGIEIWNGNSLCVLEGSGTVASPYLIGSVEELASVAYYVNNEEGSYATARYKLVSDIEINSSVDWVAIGTATAPFSGTFNGNSHKISFNQTSSTSTFGGIFGYCDDSSYIYDLYLEGTKVQTTSQYAGAIAMVTSGTISSCSSSLDISGINVGGLVGLIKNQDSGEKITNSFATSTLEGEEVGGLVAHFETVKDTSLGIYDSGYIFSSYFSGKITGKVVGGIVARANGVLLMNNIVNAEINVQDDENAFAGGLVGILQFEDIFSTKNVSNVKNYLLNNKIYVDFSASTFGTEKNQDTTGLLIGKAFGTIGQGYYLLENNVVKNDNKHLLFNGTIPQAMICENQNKLSNDKVFEGDFDFDNEAFYDSNSNNWFTINGSVAFDMTVTFEVKKNSMPVFRDIEFWLNSTSTSLSGLGTEESPYEISSAYDLAFLSAVMASDYYYESYANKHYVLTEDIDLSGKVWVGIGSIKRTWTNNVLSKTEIYGFSGVFDGQGHSILNMTSIPVSSLNVGAYNDRNWTIWTFNSGLFSVTSPSTETTGFLALKTSINSLPTIKNLTIEDSLISGSYAGSVVSRAFLQVCLSNVTAMNVEVSGSAVAGGLVGSIEGLGGDYLTTEISSTIENCYVLGTLSGNIVGGAVGYLTNASAWNKTASLKVSNFLLRGEINVFGSDHDAEYSQTYGASYYRPIAGSIVGVMMSKELEIVNCVCLENIVSYVQGASMGAFVGGTGVGDSYASSTMTISVDGSKFVGSMFDVFNCDKTFCGSVVGITHDGIASSLTINVSNTTHTNVNSSVVYRSNLANCQISSEIQYSEDEVGFGDFAIYDNTYFSNSDYFNLENQWTEEQINRLYFVVTFYFENKIIFGPYVVKNGETITVPENVELESSVQYDYTFVGWDRDLSDINRNMRVNAVYDSKLRSYKVSYLNEKGEEIKTLELEYGSYVNNQNVEAPKKKGNLIYKYEFKHFGEEYQTVTGEIQVSAVYEKKLTKFAQGLIVVGLFTIFCVLVVVVNKKSRA